MKPAKSNNATLAQIVKAIPPYLVSRLATKHGCDEQARVFTPWSHVVTLIFAQLSHSFGLNEVCDTLRLHSGVLTSARHAHPPARNTLSHANEIRNPLMMEELFWEMQKHLIAIAPPGFERRYCGLPRKFKRMQVSAMDSSTISLIARCMDWAKHRCRKAAVKLHMLLSLGSFLPKFASVKPAKGADPTEAPALCADLSKGDTVVFDRAYNDFKHLRALTQRGVWWVGRAKKNMKFEVVRTLSIPRKNVLRDVEIRLTAPQATKAHPGTLRLVEAWVELEGRNTRVKMAFITNNFTWAASSVTDLYRSRWGIEVFFKEIKQTLKLGGFLGNNENAIKWQIWAALLTMLLLRYLAAASKWSYSFIRLVSFIRGAMWECYDLIKLLASCGIARAPPKLTRATAGEYLPGLESWRF